ncbi:UNVERIFIED_CONTAM: hypothetical protein RMT77_005422 [Armadillidium vulgare]
MIVEIQNGGTDFNKDDDKNLPVKSIPQVNPETYSVNLKEINSNINKNLQRKEDSSSLLPQTKQSHEDLDSQAMQKSYQESRNHILQLKELKPIKSCTSFFLINSNNENINEFKNEKHKTQSCEHFSLRCEEFKMESDDLEVRNICYTSWK